MLTPKGFHKIQIYTGTQHQFLFSVASPLRTAPRAFKVGSKPLALNLSQHGQAFFFLSLWSSFFSRGSGLYEFHAHCRWSRLVQRHDLNHWYCLGANSSISKTLAMVCHPFVGCIIRIGRLFTMVCCQRPLPKMWFGSIRTPNLEALPQLSQLSESSWSENRQSGLEQFPFRRWQHFELLNSMAEIAVV